MNELLFLSVYQVTSYKNQLTGKYERKFSVFNISHIKFIIYLGNFTTVNILGHSHKIIQQNILQQRFQSIG